MIEWFKKHYVKKTVVTFPSYNGDTVFAIYEADIFGFTFIIRTTMNGERIPAWAYDIYRNCAIKAGRYFTTITQ